MTIFSTHHRRNNNRGFTILEALLTIAILGIIGVAVSNFQKNIINFNSGVYNTLSAQADGRRIVKTIVSELRSTSPSALGSYPIEVASTTVLAFYSDADNDGQSERIRYFLSNNKLQKGVIKPSGNPVGYTGTETVTTLISDIVNNVSPVFEYYDSAYSGTSTPMSQPVNIVGIRLIKVTVYIDKDPNRSPTTILLTSQVSMRNLKDNL